ncbi:hypothetical protein GCM10023187_48480 [Nibrella viscosa]|uniref:Uncharacterized protein n=1 Tax=Nibrella viscosa TaxID=1084524 RepID=A0ABP8KU50_9BACT
MFLELNEEQARALFHILCTAKRVYMDEVEAGKKGFDWYDPNVGLHNCQFLIAAVMEYFSQLPDPADRTEIPPQSYTITNPKSQNERRPV